MPWMHRDLEAFAQLGKTLKLVIDERLQWSYVHNERKLRLPEAIRQRGKEGSLCLAFCCRRGNDHIVGPGNDSWYRPFLCIAQIGPASLPDESLDPLVEQVECLALLVQSSHLERCQLIICLNLQIGCCSSIRINFHCPQQLAPLGILILFQDRQ